MTRFFFFFSILLALGVGLLGCNSSATNSANFVYTDTLPPEPILKYGLPVDSFVLVTNTIKKNQFLADILLKHHVPYVTIDALVKAVKDTYDVRRLASGKNYTLFLNNDSLQRAAYFIYEPNAYQYVVYGLGDSLYAAIYDRDVTYKTLYAEGEIESSLYMTLTNAGVSPALAIEMSEIYAWSIDFYRIQKGDRFRVLYQGKYVDSNFVGIGDIIASEFVHSGEPFQAFPFEQDSIVDYYNEEGKSLRKAFLKSPLKFGRLTSGYTNRRFHPVQKRWKAHKGTDYAAPKGTPIRSTGDGRVIAAKYSRFNGNYVKIRHNSTYTTQYLHMSKFASGISVGKVVRQGDVIGYVGSTGLATGPHVCYRFWKNGKQVDHRREKLPASKPIKPENLHRFNRTVDSLKNEMKMLGPAV